jgi:hypothetical protein
MGWWREDDPENPETLRLPSTLMSVGRKINVRPSMNGVDLV